MNTLFQDKQTGGPLDYRAHNAEYGIADWFGLQLSPANELKAKIDKKQHVSVDPTYEVPFAAEIDDLIRLHFLCLNRRVTTVMEFGVGKSTRVFAEAMRTNQARHGDYVEANLRRADAFQVFSVDNSSKWVETCKEGLPTDLAGSVDFSVTEVEMTTFNGRICTAYRRLPNVCPDLIYLDGPGQYGVKGDVRGITTETKDRLPMAADLLMMEPFLLPGTLIVVDGRTANARFLRNNLQGNWEYQEFTDFELNTLELKEPPLGRINQRQLDYCLRWEE